MIPKFKLSTCSLVVSSALLALSGVAHADGTLEQQVMQLQQQVKDLQTAVKQNAGTAGNAAAAKKSSDAVSLSDTPDGYRLIDTDTSSVGIYGLIDLTVAHESSGGPNGGANALGGPTNNKPWTGLDVSWMNGNRWGITGSHVLDKDSQTKLVFRLESEFELPTGNFDGGYSAPILFNRDAWIGVASPTIGKVTFGRQDTLGRDINMIWANPFSTDKNSYNEGGWMNNQVMYQMMEYSGSPTGNRWDGAAVWKKKWDNLYTYLGHQFAGLQNTGSTDNVYVGKGLTGTQDAAGLGYNGDGWNVSSSYTHANYDGYAKDVESLGGNFRPVSWLRINGGVYHAAIAQPAAVGDRTDNAYTVSTQIYPGGKFDYALAYYHIDAKNAGTNGVGGSTLQPFDLTNAITTAADGTWGTIYGAMFYRWDKQTDLYMAADYSKVGGGYNSGYFNGNRDINQVGVGVRYFF